MDDPYAIDVLGAEECWTLVRRSVVGRLALIVDGRPAIFPINFTCDGPTIVFRTAAGTKLASARGRPVAFEVDGYDAAEGEAWSVIVSGPADEIDDTDELERAHDLPLFPWHVAPKAHLVRIAADEISGRRFRTPYAGSTGLTRPRP